MGDIFRDTFLGFVRIHVLYHASIVSGKVRGYCRATTFGRRELGKLRGKLRELTQEVLE